jgi:hypothetical protein
VAVIKKADAEGVVVRQIAAAATESAAEFRWAAHGSSPSSDGVNDPSPRSATGDSPGIASEQLK